MLTIEDVEYLEDLVEQKEQDFYNQFPDIDLYDLEGEYDGLV